MAGLEININKTKFMRNEIINYTDITDNININGNDYEVIYSFKYLGSNITQNNDVTSI